MACLAASAPPGARVLALHGWLDNAASFVPLAAELPGLDLVAIDLPGHGHSAHLPPGTQYNTPGAICHVLDVADALGWDRFSLIGHSMGAGIASLTAAAAPERIERLVAIEALGGLRGPENENAQRLRDHVRAARALPGRNLRVFPDLSTPIRARMMTNQLSEPCARLLVERGVKAVDGGYSWCSDPRLMLPTAMRLSEAQIDDLLAAIECPTQVIYATPAYIESNPQTVQKVVNAFVHSLKWIAAHSAEDIAKLMPEEYALGNLPLYIKALTVSKPMYSPDGHFEPGAVGTAYAVLRVFDPVVAGATFDLTKTYNDTFVKKAISGK